MAAPAPKELAQALQALTDQYAKGRTGSDEDPLGRASVITLEEALGGRLPSSVLQGYAIRFDDGTTYLVNVHLVPGTVPQAPPK